MENELLLSDEDFTIELFCRVDDLMIEQKKHSQAKLYPSEVVTLAMLFALKGVGQLAFDRWIRKNFRHLFPKLPHRTRLFRLFNSHSKLIDNFMGTPSLLAVIDSYGIELIHPRREGRSKKQLGKKGISNKRWIVGGKLCYVTNHIGQVITWDVSTANVYDGTEFQHLVDDLDGKTVVFSDTGFVKKDWHPDNLKACPRGYWNDRMIVETVLSMLTVVCHFKRTRHQSWEYFRNRVGWTMALFNVLIAWTGLEPDESGFVNLSIAHFSL